MGRFYLADKETLDNVNTNIGATGDTNGTTVTGSIFGKLNVLLSLWTSARAAKVDSTSADASSAKTSASQAATNTATSNTANANGTLSQKLTYIINEAAKILSRVDSIEAKAGGEQRILVRVPTVETIIPHQAGVWQTAVAINESAVVHGVYNDSPLYYTTSTRVTIDGVVYLLEKGKTGGPSSDTAKWIVQTKDGRITYSDTTANTVPINCREEFKVEINPSNAYGTDHKISTFYEVYRTGVFGTEV